MAMRPRLASLHDVISGRKRFAFLNVGWYRDDGEGRHRRTSGHWVTLAGMSESDGTPVLIVHDPSPRGKGRIFLTARPMDSGTLRGIDGWLERARGFYAIRGLAPSRAGGDICVLEGVVYLEMDRQPVGSSTVP
jgi:hypothetical protein